jgi:sodium-dependent phosphate cotransporter
VANGVKTCPEFYPTYCENDVVSYETCEVGLIGCDKDTNKCPAFFKNGAEQSTDMTSAAACLVIGISILILALLGLVWILKKMLMGASQRIIYKATSLNGYVSMVIGCLITMLVQSSSVTTSTLTPLVGLGIIPVEQVRCL